MGFLLNTSMVKKKSEDKFIFHPSSFQPANFPTKNKGFINYVFCRNWAVRDPTGTRLDSSSLVNKQVEASCT